MQRGRVRLLPCFQPDDPVMGEAVRGLAGKRSAAMLFSHGPVLARRSAEVACNAIEELEATARLALLMPGLRAGVVTAGQVADLVADFDIA